MPSKTPTKPRHGRLLAAAVLFLVALPVAAGQDAHAGHHHGSAAPSPSPVTAPPGEMAPVRPPASPAERQLEADFLLDYIRKTAPPRELFDRYLPKIGTRAILGVLEERNQYCHEEAHELGRATYALFKDVGRALAECGTGCTGACIHGVIKEAFGGGRLEDLTARLPSLCGSKALAGIEEPGNCAHGLGHALMMVAGDVDKSIDACAAFGSPAMEYYCATGVYMELFAHAGEWGQQKSLLYPCDQYTRYPAGCFRYLGPDLLVKLGGSREKLAETCRALPAAQRLGCFHGFGTSAFDFVARRPDLFASVCPSAPADDRTMCIEGVIEPLIGFNRKAAETACAQLQGAAAETCTATLGRGRYPLAKPSLALYLGH